MLGGTVKRQDIDILLIASLAALTVVCRGAVRPATESFIAPTLVKAGALPRGLPEFICTVRAYGGADAEIWRNLAFTTPKTENGLGYNPGVIRSLVCNAVTAATAGAHFCVGGERKREGSPEATIGRIAEQLAPRRPYVGLPSVPYAALHVSQQTATFVFGRNPRHPAMSNTMDMAFDYYGQSLRGWHNALTWAGLTCDVIFDDNLEAGRQRSKIENPWPSSGRRKSKIANHQLSDYPLLIMPLAVALTTGQYESIMAYVRRGGVLVTGPWFGICDEWGEPRETPLGDIKSFPFGRQMFAWDELENRRALRLTNKSSITVCPLSCLPESANSVSLPFTGRNLGIRITRFGRGRVVQAAVDMGTLLETGGNDVAADAVGRLMTALARPLVEVSNPDGDLALGVFKKDKAGQTMVVHVQQMSPPWRLIPQQPAAPMRVEPPALWNTALSWNGARPCAIRCVLPEPGPALPIRRRKNTWQVELPPFTWGQVIVVETGKRG